MHIYMAANRVRIFTADGMSPVQHQAITWTNVGILLIGPLGIIFGEIEIKMQKFAFF